MALTSIQIPDAIRELRLTDDDERLIDRANDRIESFLLSDRQVRENFVTCDFPLAAQSLAWIQDNHLLTGNRFCELGSGFGVVAMLAAARGMDAVGIELDAALVNQSVLLASEFQNSARFYRGSFIPNDQVAGAEQASELEHLQTDERDAYDDIGLTLGDFDLCFAYPWPDEHSFLAEMFQACAADGALLLTYRGRDGMELLRRI